MRLGLGSWCRCLQSRRQHSVLAVYAPLMTLYIPPVALIFTCRAVMPSSLQRVATSCAANMAAYGEDSSRSALTFMPPVTRLIVSRPLEITQVSL